MMERQLLLILLMGSGLLMKMDVCSTNIHFNEGHHGKSCLDLLRNGAVEDGFYQIVDDTNKRYTVYCDFTSEPGSAWTLIESHFAMRIMREIREKSFAENSPVMENTPNWILFRLSHPRMSSLRKASTHWRATCSLHAYKVDYHDYMRGNFADFDIMTYEGHGICKKVDYVNIRGHAAVNSQVRIWQVKNTYHLHIDSSTDGCPFVPKGGSVSSEDNFGYYGTVNNKFRCANGPSATTQWWFGGYL